MGELTHISTVPCGQKVNVATNCGAKERGGAPSPSPLLLCPALSHPQLTLTCRLPASQASSHRAFLPPPALPSLPTPPSPFGQACSPAASTVLVKGAYFDMLHRCTTSPSLLTYELVSYGSLSTKGREGPSPLPLPQSSSRTSPRFPRLENHAWRVRIVVFECGAQGRGAISR